MKLLAKPPVDHQKIFPHRQTEICEQFVLCLFFSGAESIGRIHQGLAEIEYDCFDHSIYQGSGFKVQRFWVQLLQLLETAYY